MTAPMATTRMTPVCHEAECEPHIDACGPLRLTHPQTGLAQKEFRPPQNITIEFQNTEELQSPCPNLRAGCFFPVDNGFNALLTSGLE
jgi:hypothetical protein